MDFSVFFQILGSLFVVVGYWLNSKGHDRQHMLFVLGHLCLISFAALDSKWVLVALSVFVIYMQLKISKRKYKFKKDIVRVKKVAAKIKPEKFPIVILKRDHENKGVHKAYCKIDRNRHKKGHVLQGGKESVG